MIIIIIDLYYIIDSIRIIIFHDRKLKSWGIIGYVLQTINVKTFQTVG